MRLAKAKYYDRGEVKSMAEATERILTEQILPNTSEVMSGQEFRDKELWDLDMHDLLKANSEGILSVYRYFRINGRTHGLFQIDDACLLVETMGFSGNEFRKKAALAYSLSKQSIINEMEESSMYNDMKLFEFHEFLVRLAHLVFSAEEYGESYPVIKKVRQLL